MVYEPREDSFLLLKAIRILDLRGEIALDMGCGSGIVTEELCRRFKIVYAIDIDEEALEVTRERCKNFNNLKVFLSDLFEALKDSKIKFDLITFNPPYLPCSYEEDPELCCGKDCSIIRRFLKESYRYLKPSGIILIVISSLTPLRLKGAGVIARKRLSFEEIAVLKINRKLLETLLPQIGGK